MKQLLTMTVSTMLVVAPCFAQTATHTAGSTLGSPTVPGTVRTDSPGITGAPAESFGADAAANESPAITPVPTDNAPIRESDLTNETTKYPPPPSLRPWAPTTTSSPITNAPQ
jgi:hypothetical protein